jgi:hypothetical protein
MTSPSTPPAAPPPLTPDQLGAIQLAHTRSTKLRRAAVVAKIDASVMAVFTAFCLLSALFDPVTGIVLGAALGLVTFNSFRGAAGLRRFDPAAPRLLAWNQLILAVSVIVYALYALYTGLRGNAELDKSYREIAALDPDMGKMLQDTSRLIVQILYVSLIAGTVVAQSLTAWYYASRAKLLRTYLAQTPPWVIELQKHQASHP